MDGRGEKLPLAQTAAKFSDSFTLPGFFDALRSDLDCPIAPQLEEQFDHIPTGAVGQQRGDKWPIDL
jgi:hypothetical protein